ncbi:hypothetical protein ACET3Z_013474 [Daucus carota]
MEEVKDLVNQHYEEKSNRTTLDRETALFIGHYLDSNRDLQPLTGIQEGSNLVVVRSSDHRKKLLSRENCVIKNGNVIELNPGYHFFTFLSVGNSVAPSSQKKDCSEGNRVGDEDESVSWKRAKQVSQDEAFVRNLQVPFY